MSVSFGNITKGAIDGSGWFDQYLRSTRAQLNEAVKNNEITQEIYGQVLSAGIAPMMQQATEFELRREGADAEIALRYAALEIQQAELAIKQAELALKEQQLELAERDQDDKELTSAKQREHIDEQIDASEAVTLLNDRAQGDKEATSAKQREQLDEQIDASQSDTVLSTRAQDDKEATSAKQRDLLSEQINESIQNVLGAARKVDSWDDNLLMKLTEMQANVASFYVNAKAEGAETSAVMIDLKDMMQAVSQRSQNKLGSQTPLPPQG